MTTTIEGATLELSPDTLTLVEVAEDYFTTGSQWTGAPREDRTYYAIPHRNLPNYGTLVVHRSDPRHTGMRRPDAEEREVLTRMGLDTGEHEVWTLEGRYLSPVDQTPTPDPDAPLAVGDRVKVSDTHPAGSDWQGHVGVVESATEAYVSIRMETGPRAGTSGGFRPEYLTRIAPQESSEGSQAVSEVLTVEEVDRRIREAVEAERARGDQRLESWKAEANRIAVDYAEANDLCGNFEAAMSDIGLLGRAEWHDQNDPEWTVTFTVTVRASDDDDARSSAVDKMYNMGHGSLYDVIANVSED